MTQSHKNMDEIIIFFAFISKYSGCWKKTNPNNAIDERYSPKRSKINSTIGLLLESKTEMRKRRKN